MTLSTLNQKSSLFQLRETNMNGFRQNHTNVIIHSRLTHFERREEDSGLSVKMTVKGQENYRIDGRTFRVREGEYLVVNKGQQFDCFMEKSELTEGICIYLDPKTVEDIFRTLSSENEELLDLPFFDSNKRLTFFESKYTVFGNALGDVLRKITPPVSMGDTSFADEDFFIMLCEKLIETQSDVLGHIERIKSEKVSTRKELYRRLLEARNFMDSCYQEKISIADIASRAALSEYHLHRTFRQCFGITPHKYIVHKRLENAMHQLENGNQPVGEIAVLNGFSDIHAFSKAFKKSFGYPPTHVRKMA